MDACLYTRNTATTPADLQPAAIILRAWTCARFSGVSLARQFEQMWRLLGRPDEFVLAEAGAGTGALAKQVLDCAQESLGEFYEALRYVAIEISRAAQRSGTAS